MAKRNVVDDLRSAPSFEGAVRPINDGYLTPGRTSVGAPPNDNSLLQLSRALGQLEPVLLQYTVLAHKREVEEDDAQGEQAFNENRMAWNEAVKAGKVPLGANPHFVRAYNRAHLSDLAMEYSANLRAAWMQDDKIRASDNPDDFNKWVLDRRSEFMKTKGNLSAFSPLDIKEVFNPRLQHVEQALSSNHWTYRVGEHERLAEQTASQAVTNIFHNYFDQYRQEGRLSELGQMINDVFFKDKEGLVPNGMSASRASQLIVDNVTTIAKEAKDPGIAQEIMGVLDTIKTKGGVAGKTSYAIAQRTAVSEHLFSKQIQQEHFDHWKTVEVVRSDEDYARKKTVWDRQDKEWAHTLATYERSKTKEDKATLVQEAESHILNLLRRNEPDTLDKINEVMATLESTDTTAALRMQNHLDAIMKSKHTFTPTVETQQAAARLRAQIQENPLAYKPSQLAAHVGKTLSYEQFAAMSDDLERLQKDAEHPFLNQEFYKDLKATVKRGALKDANQEFTAEGQIAIGHALEDLNDTASAWIAEHPQGTVSQFRSFLRKEVPNIIVRHNKEAQEVVRSQEQAKRDHELAETQANLKRIADRFGIPMDDKSFKITPPKPAASEKSYGARQDGSQKGKGYFGEIPAPGGKVSTELSVGVEIDGKETLIPLIVPTLTREEIMKVVQSEGKDVPYSILNKAAEHAIARMKEGKSPFAQPGEQRGLPAPKKAVEALRGEPTAENIKAFIRTFGVDALPDDLLKK